MISIEISKTAVNTQNAMTSFNENCQAMSASGMTRKMTWSHIKNERASECRLVFSQRDAQVARGQHGGRGGE